MASLSSGGFVAMRVVSIQGALPVKMVTAPGGRIWVIDEGDAPNGINGRVFTLVPWAALESFAVTQVN